MRPEGPANATLAEREDVAPDLAVFRVRPDRVPPEEEPWFEAGQHISVSVGTEGDWLSRPYSVASPPDERRWIELWIRRATRRDDAFVERLWALRPGDRLHAAERLSGEITLEQTVGRLDPRLKLLVAAGTGLSPFASMVRAGTRRPPHGTQGDLAVLHGASTPRGLLARAELERVLDVGRRRYFPTISAPEPGEPWTGALGRVERFFDSTRIDALEHTLGLGAGGLTPARAVVYVCGHRGTIGGTIERLLRRGFVPAESAARDLLGIPHGTPSSLFFEYYGAEPLIDPTDLERLERLRAEYPRR